MKQLILSILLSCSTQIILGQDTVDIKYCDQLDNEIIVPKDLKCRPEIKALLISKQITSKHFGENIKTQQSKRYRILEINRISKNSYSMRVQHYHNHYLGVIKYELKIENNKAENLKIRHIKSLSVEL